MDRNYYYQKRAEEHQREISQEVATRHLHSEARSNVTAKKRTEQVVWRVAFAAITIITFLLLYFLG